MYKYLILAGLVFVGCQSSEVKEESSSSQSVEKKVSKAVVLKRVSTNIEDNQKISSPLHVEFNSGGAWFANEGELGSVSLVDSNNKELGKTILKVTNGNWMSNDSVTSKVVLNFKAEKSQNAKLIFNNINPADGANKIFEVAVVIEKAKTENILVGDWYQKEPSRAKKAFTLRADGTAKSISMATLLYKNYERVGADKIMFTIESVGNGETFTDKSTYIIDALSDDTMVLRNIYKGKVSKTREVYKKSLKARK